MAGKYILAIDQGTTGTRAILYDSSGRLVVSAYQEHRQYYPKPGWVEHDANEILTRTKSVICTAIKKSGISAHRIHSIGITNQRETIVLWDRKSGQPLRRAIVWQDRRTDPICRSLKKSKWSSRISRKTGLLCDPYFSGTKLKWWFTLEPELRKKAKRGTICCGTIDSWLLFHLTGGLVHATDFTNASRTLLFNIHTKSWDAELCRLMNTPRHILPRVRPSNSMFGRTKNFNGLPDGIPIGALVGDQQAALYGQGCYHAGQSKNTYGTGCFLLMNIGKKLVLSRSGLLTTIACDQEGNPVYALEGVVFIAGAAIQWLRDGLRIIKRASETEAIARKTKQHDEVVVVPAFTGLGAPYWKADARGAIFGITRGTTREAMIKATLHSIAHQVKTVFDLMVRESKTPIRALKVDGGASHNGYLMQFQADLLGIPVEVSSFPESTAWGAAKLAGLTSGFWTDVRALDRRTSYQKFSPKMAACKRTELLKQWDEAIRKMVA
ncbi:MAG: glycerol kinase [Omnitrophica bacterium RIFCSPLOWO2_12_FULL_44_17]|uniref:glycerol kinase n=1 Tax=Candidatus Danuiimicrobium aquiferis TaxID=1801832 RepID=A0A1G1KS98_9BACT|nr:MAG: glycerol kinase [Omnitrophica bacterium RIFCSPHIGHO2_02_FULL_45_28]OGW89499.1 MAG: glycerol kinase [Omnitrophica bacterium RIFCSPHIGHO2_12_FULL_44_12]OGW95429.1 MAG: glycerol kinase [Omnitrophica bacterium RIFCSPLOWO2_12_FULL_44_17]OGX03311.1 MAG: glycerol kinase [Omnitrophica bacterium RIFCSPLOWO2_02_FULL_44_11]